MFKEIGSEFHHISMENGSGIPFPRIGSLTFSGRTAIEAVLKQLPYAKSALLPSYCCDSMIDPFRRAGIDVSFFDVSYENELSIKVNGQADIVLWCNYFGFKTEMPELYGIVIEDITHSLLSASSHHIQSDYLVASVRKWEPIYCGGYCSVAGEDSLPNVAFIDKKKKAMEQKHQYLAAPDEKLKTAYLAAFQESNEWLSKNYSGLGIDSYSANYISHVDAKKQREVRRNNAHILYEGLKDKVRFLFDVDQMDCPLFVPVLLPENRNQIRQHLCDNKIYCPVHWPHPNAQCESNLYDMELSLICDQRYTEEDMERIVSVLSEKL